MSRGVLVLALLAGAASAPAPGALRVKASPAVAPCVVAAGLEYERTTGRKLSVETAAIGEHTSAEGADVVVAADQELNRVIESGATHPDLDVDVARIPWVLAAAPGTAAPETGALARSATPVRVLGGTVSREALRNLSLQGKAPGNATRFDGARGAVRLSPGEAAIVPLSLAGPGPVTPLDVPPLTARALGVRASSRTTEARAFLDFLAGPGNEAFRACGRTAAR
jgi:hypothetical protein